MSDYQFDFGGSRAVVIGGASGLGRVIATGLGRLGAHVIIVDLNMENGTEVVDMLQKAYNVTAEYISCDITDEIEVKNCFKKITDNGGVANILVNSAGVNYQRKAEEMTSNDWNSIVGVNLTGTFLTCSNFGYHLIKAGEKGCILNISSMSGIVVNKERNISAYCAAKGGVIMYTKALASEWAKNNIRVNSIAPGYFNTPFNKRWIEVEEEYNKAIEGIPLKRLGDPNEIVSLALYLCSDMSSYVTGSVFTIDGGYTVW